MKNTSESLNNVLRCLTDACLCTCAISMQSTGQEAWKSKRSLGNSVEACKNISHLNHFISRSNGIKEREEVEDKTVRSKEASQYMQCHYWAIKRLFPLIRDPHSNVHEPLQWSTQRAAKPPSAWKLFLSLLRVGVDHLWLTQLG